MSRYRKSAENTYMCLRLLLSARTAIAIPALFFCLPVFATDGNLVPNGGFEAGPWESGGFSGTRPDIEWVSPGYSGSAGAMRMQSANPYYAYLNSEIFAVEPETAYVVSAWVRITDVATPGVTFNVSWRDRSLAPIKWHGAIGGVLQDTSGWEQLESKILSPLGAAFAHVQMRANTLHTSKGTSVLVDEVFLGVPGNVETDCGTLRVVWDYDEPMPEGVTLGGFYIYLNGEREVEVGPEARTAELRCVLGSELWATAFDTEGNESEHSNHILVRLEDLLPIPGGYQVEVILQ